MLAILLGPNEIGVIVAVAGIVIFLTSRRLPGSGPPPREARRQITRVSKLSTPTLVVIALVAVGIVVGLAWLIARYILT
ncbi:MAG: hypothetical protein K9M57_06085 [Phycisphaerae bacterium]|nr:hypothetical protein [Phycisphaerae bacterium]